MPDSQDPSDEKGLLEKLKESTSRVKDKAESIAGTVKEKAEDIKETSGDHIAITREIADYQSDNLKSEAQFMKKIFKSRDLVFMKTDAFAVVLRKLGGNEEFLQTVDKLTREGYRLVHQENVRDIPIFAGFKYSFGSLYYFQHIKYIGTA